MKDRVKQKDFFVYWKPGSQNMGVISKNMTHHITIGKFVLRVCIWKSPYLRSIIRLCTDRPMLCSHQSIRLQSCQTVLFCKSVLMAYIRTDTQVPQWECSTYEKGGTWKHVCKKDDQTRSRSPNKLNTRSTCGRLSYLW